MRSTRGNRGSEASATKGCSWLDKQEFQSITSSPEGYAARGKLAPGYCVQGQADCVSCGIEKLKKIHTCYHNCVLFHGENEDLDHCPEYGTMRHKHRKDGGDDGEDNINEERKKGTPRKVARYFSLISRL